MDRTLHLSKALAAQVCCCAALLVPWSGVQAQQELADTERPTGWSNATDIGVSVTGGNSNADCNAEMRSVSAQDFVVSARRTSAGVAELTSSLRNAAMAAKDQPDTRESAVTVH